MKLILTVCVGNICRSPMAEGMLSAALPLLEVRSAGIGALVGFEADPIAIDLMAERGIDITRHRAQQINKLLCQQADIILVMDQEQRRYVEARYAFTRGKTFRVAEALKLDVPDPYQKDRGVFQNAMNLIEQGTENWIEKIKKLIEYEKKTK